MIKLLGSWKTMLLADEKFLDDSNACELNTSELLMSPNLI